MACMRPNGYDLASLPPVEECHQLFRQRTRYKLGYPI